MHIVLLAFSVISPSSMEYITNYWVPEIEEYGKGSLPFILVGTKIDLRNDKDSVAMYVL